MNAVKLGGTAKRIRGGDGNTTSWAFALVEAEHKGKKVSHSVKAFGEPADKLRGLEEGSEVEITGHLERQKKQGSHDDWETIVVADKVTTREPAEDDIPF